MREKNLSSAWSIMVVMRYIITWNELLYVVMQSMIMLSLYCRSSFSSICDNHRNRSQCHGSLLTTVCSAASTTARSASSRTSCPAGPWVGPRGGSESRACARACSPWCPSSTSSSSASSEDTSGRWDEPDRKREREREREKCR